MKKNIFLSLKQKELGQILIALMFYKTYEKNFDDISEKEIQELINKLNKKFMKTVKITKLKEDNWPI